MGLLDKLRSSKWKPDLTREPPDCKDYPSTVRSLSAKSFDDFIDKYPLSVIDFWAGWCAPCKTVRPRVRQLSRTYKGKVAFGMVNIETEKWLSDRYHIQSVPNIVFFSYGEKVTNLSGVKTVSQLQEQIDRILAVFSID